MSAPWPARLAAALRMFTARAPAPDVSTADQLDAAARDVSSLLDRLTIATAPTSGPWRRLTDLDADQAVPAVAGVLGCDTICVHLRRGGPRPAVANLALRRIDCERCARTVRTPPAGEDDRCDWCGRRGVVEFHPVAFQIGALLAIGDACTDCDEQLVGQPIDTGTPT